MTKAELDSWTRSTSKDVRDWFAAQPQVANMEVIEHDIQEALNAYGRVSNIEIEAYADDITTTMRVDFDVTCGLFSFDYIRDALLQLPWIHRIVNCYYTPSTKRLTINITFDAFDCLERRKEVMEYMKYGTTRYPKATGVFVPQIDRVTFNGPATIVFWTDGTKTIVKCMEDEEFDPEKGLAMAICKRLYGGDFHRVFKDTLKNAKTRKGDEIQLERAARIAKAKKKKVKAKKKKMPYDYT